MIKPTRGMAAKFKRSEAKVTRLKFKMIKGRTPSWAVRLKAKISLILKGSLGRNFMIFGKKRMMDKVAPNVN